MLFSLELSSWRMRCLGSVVHIRDNVHSFFFPHLLQSVTQSSCAAAWPGVPKGTTLDTHLLPHSGFCGEIPPAKSKTLITPLLHAEKFNCYLWSALNAHEMLFLALLRAQAAGIWQGNS